MSKKRRQQEQPKEIESESRPGHQDVQNEPPMLWDSWEAFWNSCVKGGTPSLMVACKEHVRCLGWLGDQSRWIKGAIHFGITIEK
jgi:hypothetical protein